MKMFWHFLLRKIFFFAVLKPGKDLHFFTEGVWETLRSAQGGISCRFFADRHAKNERK